MTTQAMAAPPGRTVRDALPAGLAGVAVPHLVALAGSPVLLLLIASSALGFRLGARG